MAAASYSLDVLQRYYGRIPSRENVNLPVPLVPRPIPKFDGFQITKIIFMNGFVFGE